MVSKICSKRNILYGMGFMFIIFGMSVFVYNGQEEKYQKNAGTLFYYFYLKKIPPGTERKAGLSNLSDTDIAKIRNLNDTEIKEM